MVLSSAASSSAERGGYDALGSCHLFRHASATALLEGTRVGVVLRAVGDDADGWDLSDDEWAELDESIAEADRGELISADVVLAELRALK